MDGVQCPTPSPASLQTGTTAGAPLDLDLVFVSLQVFLLLFPSNVFTADRATVLNPSSTLQSPGELSNLPRPRPAVGLLTWSHWVWGGAGLSMWFQWPARVAHHCFTVSRLM